MVGLVIGGEGRGRMIGATRSAKSVGEHARVDDEATPPPPTADALLPSDRALLDRVRWRDEAALAALYDRYGGLVFTIALRVLGDGSLAEEVMQDVFLRCWDGAETFRPERGHAAGWLMGIARHRAIDLLRSRQHRARARERTPLSDPTESGRPAGQPGQDEAEAVVNRHAMAAALATLPPTQRQVIELAYYGGFSQAEIAQRLGDPLGTVKTRTRAALDRLREQLSPSRPTGSE